MNFPFNGILVVEDRGQGNFVNTTFREVYDHLRNGGILALYRTETTAGGYTRSGILFPYIYWAENQYAGHPEVFIIGSSTYCEGEDGSIVQFTP